jgi:hypothetical protein
VWPGAQKTHQNDLLDTCVLRRCNDVARPFNVNTSIRLLTDLAIDAGAVCDHSAASERRRQLIDVVETAPRSVNHFVSFTRQASG